MPLHFKGAMKKEELLAEIEDTLRCMPPRGTIRHETAENLSWFGRVAAAIGQWDSNRNALVERYMEQFHTRSAENSDLAFRNLMTLLHQARHDLRMTVGPLNVVIGTGMSFDYFDEIRKIVETAQRDVLFVDPYLDAEFVSRYLGHIAAGVNIRLLARERIQTLIPAVELYAKQSNTKIEVRSGAGFHDRYLFVDNSACYQSGASFKDGAKKAPTTVTQIIDAFPAVLKTYEDLWTGGKVLFRS